MLELAHQHAVVRPVVFVELRHILHHPGPERIQVNVAYKLTKIGILITECRLVPILEKVTLALVAQVK